MYHLIVGAVLLIVGCQALADSAWSSLVLYLQVETRKMNR